MTARRRRLVAGALLATAAWLVPASAGAHGIAGRADLPIPAELFGLGAAVVLVVSFAALAAGWTRPRLQAWTERPLFALPVGVDVALGALGVALFGLVVWAGLTGTAAEGDNLAPTAIYVGLWVGVPCLSLLVGDVFRLLSPWRAIARAAGWLARRLGAGSEGDPLPYPAWLGRWPAVAGIAAFGLCELVWDAGREPTPLAAFALLYAVLQLVGMSLYGVEVWSRRGDALGTYCSLFASLTPVTRTSAGRLALRPPLAGATRLAARPGTTALLLVAIATTAFDGAKEGRIVAALAPGIQDAFVDLGASKALGLELALALGYLATIALLAVGWRLAALGLPRPHDGGGRGGPFAHALVPILAAYVLAHYVSLLLYDGQDLARLLSDPRGSGADWLGTAGATIDYGVISATGIWYVQVAALVVGHVVGLVLGHDRALALHDRPGAAVGSQVAMLVVMVCLTCLGLFLLSVANA